MGFQIRLWVGSFIFGFGILFWTWFIRNIFKSRLHKPPLYRNYHPIIHVTWNSIWVILGLWIYPSKGIIPVIPLILGIAIGLYISRSAKNIESSDNLRRQVKQQENITHEGLSAAIFMAMVNNEKDVETTLQSFSVKNIDDVKLELKFLKVFSTIHLIITTVTDDNLRQKILETFYSFLFSKSSENYFGCPFELISEKFGIRLNKYFDAISEQNPNGLSHSIGKQFSKFIGQENDIESTHLAAIFFSSELMFKEPVLDSVLKKYKYDQ